MGDVVAVPELGLEVGDPLVVDHEPRGGERLKALVDLLRVVADVVGAALHRREPDALPGTRSRTTLESVRTSIG